MTVYHQIPVNNVNSDDIAAGRIFHRFSGENWHTKVKPGELVVEDGFHYLQLTQAEALIRVPINYLFTSDALQSDAASEYTLRAEHQHAMIHVGDLLIDVARNDRNGVRVSIERDGIEMAHASVELNDDRTRTVEDSSFSEIDEHELRILLLLARLGAGDNDHLEAVESALNVPWRELIAISDRLNAATQADHALVMEELGYD